MTTPIGTPLPRTPLVLTKGREFSWSFQNLDETTKAPTDFPDGDLYFEFADVAATKWHFTISGGTATLTATSTEVDAIQPNTNWQLVFLATGDTAGGQPIALGSAVIQQ